MKILFLAGLIGTTAFAQGVQNMDFSFMFGRTVAAATAGPANVSADASFSYQVSYGYQFAATKVGNLFLEIPNTFVFNPVAVAVLPGSVSVGDRSSWYLTPGVRLKIPTGTRLSFYGAAGGGFGRYHETDTVVNGQISVKADSTFHPVFDFGGGADLRVARWLSLRGDVRDFVSSAGLGGTTGHNHAIFVFGIAFHR